MEHIRLGEHAYFMGNVKAITLRCFGQDSITCRQRVITHSFLCISCLLPCLPGEFYPPKTHILLFTFIFLLTAQFHTGPIMWPLTGRLTGVGTCQLNKHLNEIQSAFPLKWDAASNCLSTSGEVFASRSYITRTLGQWRVHETERREYWCPLGS